MLLQSCTKPLMYNGGLIQAYDKPIADVLELQQSHWSYHSLPLIHHYGEIKARPVSNTLLCMAISFYLIHWCGYVSSGLKMLKILRPWSYVTKSAWRAGSTTLPSYIICIYKLHLSKQWNCWSLRCSWTIHRLLALFQLHLHSQLNTWFRWIGQRHLQDEMWNM